MPTDRPTLLDSTVYWLGVGALLAALSAIPLIVGAGQRVGNDSLWNNGWFRLGIFVAFLGVVALLWALVLAVAHRYAGKAPAPDGTQLERKDHFRITARQVRAEIATCRAMLDEASKSGHYPWSSFEHKLPAEVWSVNNVPLAVVPEARDAYHFATMAYAQFARVNRLVTEMAVARPPVHPEHQIDAAIQAAEVADHALVEFDVTLS